MSVGGSVAPFLPVLSPSDIQQAAHLINQVYSPLPPSTLRALQQSLFDIQRKVEAWGLVVPLLEWEGEGNANVQFFGAHTLQVKIARDWDQFPQEHAEKLKEVLVELTGRAIRAGRNKVILRKLFVSLTSLALKLTPLQPSLWPDWIISSVSSLSNDYGAKQELALEFLEICAEEVDGADLLGGQKIRMQQTLKDAIPLVTQLITAAIVRARQSSSATDGKELEAAMKCLEAWVGVMTASDITPLIPPLITLLTPTQTPQPTPAFLSPPSFPSPVSPPLEFSEKNFIPASSALSEILSNSPLSDGSGRRTLSEPLLGWVERWGGRVVGGVRESGFVDPVAHSYCKLLVALGDHSTSYIAANIASPTLVDPAALVPSLPVTQVGDGGVVGGISGSSTPIWGNSSLPPPVSFDFGSGSGSGAGAGFLAPPTFPQNQQVTPEPKPKSTLIQTYLHHLLSFTSLPGFYGVDEEESEMTLGFWYLFQEALWGVQWGGEGSGDEEGEGVGVVDADDKVWDWGVEVRDKDKDEGWGVPGGCRQEEVKSEKEMEREREREKAEKDLWRVAKAVYGELVGVLRRKCVWPGRDEVAGWAKDQREKFQVYRRDVGDTLINAYYILRNDMLAFYVNDVVERLNGMRGDEGWEEIEATLHCIMSIQEAVPMDEPDNPHLVRVFGPEVLGRLPTSGHHRVRRTMVGLIGNYSSWFTCLPPTPPSNPSLLMNAISYVVSALPEQALCLHAANALRDLCDANRAALAPHVGAFGELHAGLNGIPDTEKSKVLQSIASVIQGLLPEEEIAPVEAIVSPVVSRLFGALQSSTQLPEEARSLAIQQLQALSGVAKGLTNGTDALLADEDVEKLHVERMDRARGDERMVKLREAILGAIRGCVELMSTDAGVSEALSDLFKSITSLPFDMTLLSLPAGPLLELLCLAAQRQLTAVWLSLASMLFVQLDPPSPVTLKSAVSPENWAVVTSALPVLLQISLSALGQEGAMESNPDIAQAFFGCMDTIAAHFIEAFYRLPPGAFDALMRCTIKALSLQERYSLVSACTFLISLVNRTTRSDDLGDAREILVQGHGKAIMRSLLFGFAGIAPRTATPNLYELLSTLLARCPTESRAWIHEIILADDFIPSKASREAKEKFVKAVAGSRSMKRTKEAAQEFTLVARGLEGSSFGYTSVVNM
ncbi:hypothetical protein JAAARDRAFT_36863 [Jaapia argillacea MUCL 33604]|uniref:Importin-13 n=1 Tax=Jaapia argillacea MUCL 33604 TaxID=933084 RepID=A0A067PMP9_9AGAM|nr:hypothetical protein JAAARDRAFT_36863 [Jaapia argillacea MUCL 33604]